MIRFRDDTDTRQHPVQNVDDRSLIFADVAEKAVAQVRESVKGLLRRSLDEKKAEELAGLLSTGTWTHDFPITVDTARALGLNVSTDMPEEVFHLMSLFPQPVKRQPSVEYLPVPRRMEREGGHKT